MHGIARGSARLMELIVRVENDPSLIGTFEGTVEGSMLDDWYHRRLNEIENTYYTIATVGWDDVRDKEPGEFGAEWRVGALRAGAAGGVAVQGSARGFLICAASWVA